MKTRATPFSQAHTLFEKYMNKNRILSVKEASKILLFSTGFTFGTENDSIGFLKDMERFNLIRFCKDVQYIRVQEW